MAIKKTKYDKLKLKSEQRWMNESMEKINKLHEKSRALLEKYLNILGRRDYRTKMACFDLVNYMTNSDFGRTSMVKNIMEVFQQLGYQGHYPEREKATFRVVGDAALENKMTIRRIDAGRESSRLYTTTFEGQPAVLKISTVIGRFFREAAAYATLGNKYPIQPLALYNEGGYYGFVLPLLDWGGNFPIEKTFFDVWESLDIIHSCGLIHGDVKTENMLVCEGKMVMIDFEHTVAIGSWIETIHHPAAYRPHKGEYPPIELSWLAHFLGILETKIPCERDDYYALCKASIHYMSGLNVKIGERWEISAWREALERSEFDGIRKRCLEVFDEYH